MRKNIKNEQRYYNLAFIASNHYLFDVLVRPRKNDENDYKKIIEALGPVNEHGLTEKRLREINKNAYKEWDLIVKEFCKVFPEKNNYKDSKSDAWKKEVKIDKKGIYLYLGIDSSPCLDFFVLSLILFFSDVSACKNYPKNKEEKWRVNFNKNNVIISQRRITISDESISDLSKTFFGKDKRELIKKMLGKDHFFREDQSFFN